MALCALLQLLRQPPKAIEESGMELPSRFADLVVKCLIKLTKMLQSGLEVRMHVPLA